MSVMIAVAAGRRIAVAADSRWASGWDTHACAQPKVQRRGEFLLTVGPSCGLEHVLWSEVCGLAQQSENWPEQWATHVFGAQDATVTRRMATTTETKDAKIIVVWRGRLFEVYGSGAIFESGDGIVTAGCGGDFARAAAVLLRRKLRDAKTIATQAAIVACECSAGCAPPIVCEVVDL